MGSDFTANFLPSDVAAGSSNARTTFYDAPADRTSTTLNNTSRIRLTLFNPGVGNDQLALTYSSFGLFDYQFGTGEFLAEDYRAFAYYAQTTPDAAVPRAGTSTYTGRIIGEGNPALTDASPRYAVTGTIVITVDWAARTFVATITAVGDDGVRSGVSLGTILASQNIMPASPGQFSGAIQGQAAPNGLSAQLAGPAGEELAGSMTFRIFAPTGGSPAIDVVASFGSRR